MRFGTGIFCALAMLAQPEPAQLTISGDKQWTDTGIDLVAGETLRIEASGTLKYPGKKQGDKAREAGPNGLPKQGLDLVRVMPAPDAGQGALIARLGNRDSARPMLVGAKKEIVVTVSGRLMLGVNQNDRDKAEGSYNVKIERVPPKQTEAKAVEVPVFPQDMLEKIPRRVSDAQGTEGDLTNFVVIGAKDKVQAALKAAGWVVVDKDSKQALLASILASLNKQAYVTMPMSELMLFGRGQDFGYAQGDPLTVVAARHHFRIWKAPFDLEGREVWVGAGTHDIGFDRDQRNNKVTHKIDPDVDQERDYIGQSMSESGLVLKLDYMTAAGAIKSAKTAHGEEFHSDGRTLLIYLKPD